MGWDNLTWNRFKDVAIVALIGLAIQIFQSNMSELNDSVKELNEKVGEVVVKTQVNESEISMLRTQVRGLEIKVLGQ